MAVIFEPRKNKTLTPFEQILDSKNLLCELDRIFVSDEFDDDQMHDEIKGEMPELQVFEECRRKGKALKDKTMPAEIASLYNNPVLSREQEYHLFRKYNFFKYESWQLLKNTHSVGVQIHVLSLLENAIAVKKFLADSNIRLALHLSKQHAFSTNQSHLLWQIVSEANFCIMKSIACFDFTRNFKFSTYATWGLRNNLGRATSDEREHSNRFSSGHSAIVFEQPYEDKSLVEQEDRNEYLKQVVELMLKKLSRREREIIRTYMLSKETPSLKTVGEHFGITRERIRQIKVTCIKKMRSMVQRGEVSLNGFLQEFNNDDKF